MLAKNQKISHSQLYCQIVLTCVGIYLLCIPGWESMLGRCGILGLGIALIVFLFCSIFLVRISYVFTSMQKYFGVWGSIVVSLFYLVFLLHSGIFLLLRMEEIIRHYLVNGVASWIIEILTILVCYMGSAKGLQRRGRLAQACVPVLLAALCLMFFLGIFQTEPRYLAVHAPLSFETLSKGSYGMFCAFVPLFLLPVTLKQVEKPYSTIGTVFVAVTTLAGILAAAMLLLQGTFGLYGTRAHTYPMIDLMAGVGLPGGFMERMDVFWIIFVVFSLLFALGSTFFYCGEVLDRIGGKQVSFLTMAVVWIGTVILKGQENALWWYGEMLRYVYIPVFLLISAAAGILGRRRKAI
ncbi:MAG: GerAB/ArcD/ProY family transporter [Lachnospiraceae bacterium]|jgi:hypothetical protein